ncbi:MAG: hypothetical protein K5634_04685 [Sphaerochaetaceae bacterium]|nr:hypothetical protein [Sphaerochaetaceae bacterium]
MKLKRFCITVLLVFSLSVLVSCNKAESAYNSGKYQQALELVEKIENPGKSDYLLKAKILNAMGRQEDARESILLYMILADDSDEREFAANMFIDLKFSDVLNALLLEPKDGVKAQITIYKAYANMGDYERAKSILADYLSTALSVSDFITLVVNYPVEPDYVVAFLTAWQANLSDNDRDHYLELMNTFSTYENLTEESIIEAIEITDKMLADEFYSSDNIKLSKVYRIRARLLTGIYDIQDAAICLEEAYRLNPEDEELKEIFANEN